MPRRSKGKVQYVPGEARVCRLEGCGTKFPLPTSAKNKEFCCTGHRQAFHTEQRAKAFQALREAQERNSRHEN